MAAASRSPAYDCAMNQDVPQPTTAIRVAGRREGRLLGRVIEPPAAHVSGCEASSAAMCAAGVAEWLCGSLTFDARRWVGVRA